MVIFVHGISHLDNSNKDFLWTWAHLFLTNWICGTRQLNLMRKHPSKIAILRKSNWIMKVPFNDMRGNHSIKVYIIFVLKA